MDGLTPSFHVRATGIDREYLRRSGPSLRGTPQLEAEMTGTSFHSTSALFAVLGLCTCVARAQISRLEVTGSPSVRSVVPGDPGWSDDGAPSRVTWFGSDASTGHE